MNPILMLCRNSLALTKRAVVSVLTQDIPNTLYIINNDSTDGTTEWLAEEMLSWQPEQNYGPIRNWRFTPAKGVSASWNFGLDYLFGTAMCDKVLVVNNDVELHKSNYRWLDLDGGPFVTGVSTDDAMAIHDGWARVKRPNPDFSNFLIRRDVWEKVGKFDESMILYCSDGDYHLRMHQAGIEAYTIGIPFYHYASGTLKSAEPNEKATILRQADLDRDTFERKWGCKMGSPEYYALFDIAARQSGAAPGATAGF